MGFSLKAPVFDCKKGGCNHCFNHFNTAFQPTNSSGSFGAHFESVFYSILVALNENLALPCEASSQTVFFHMRIE